MTPKRIKVPMTTVDMTTGESKTEDASFMLMPHGREGACEECGRKHFPHEPHDPTRLHYQYSFYAEHQRWPTWADALAHCTPEVQAAWIEILATKGINVNTEQVANSTPQMEEDES